MATIQKLRLKHFQTWKHIKNNEKSARECWEPNKKKVPGKIGKRDIWSKKSEFGG